MGKGKESEESSIWTSMLEMMAKAPDVLEQVKVTMVETGGSA